MQVTGELSGGHCVLANTAFQEVSAQRGLGKAHEIGPAFERCCLRDYFGDAPKVARVVPLAWLKLGERERDEVGH